MLAQNNNYFKEASETVYHLTQEEQIRQQCLPVRTTTGPEGD